MLEVERRLNIEAVSFKLEGIGRQETFYSWVYKLFEYYAIARIHEPPFQIRRWRLVLADTVEHSVGFVWQECAGLVLATRVLFAERWVARSWQLLMWRGKTSELDPSEVPVMDTISQSNHAYQWYLAHRELVTDLGEWAELVDTQVHRLHGRIGHVFDMATQHGGTSILGDSDKDQQLIAYLTCSSSVGVGVLHIAAWNPTATARWRELLPRSSLTLRP